MMSQTAETLAGDDLGSLRQDLLAAVAAARDTAALEETRVSALGKKGRITELMKMLGALAPEARKERGAALNAIKDDVAAALEARQKEFALTDMKSRLENERIDVTLSPRPQPDGRVHPIGQTMDEIITICAAMGLSVAKGPDIESDYYNFTALNFAADHPARQMHDTSFLPPQGKDTMLLRTHTSPVQI